ncbi:MAG: hypothetical protein LBM70_05005 [Victivallales bacterium]|jgi:lipoate-protein ligase A|nr:hypothetical protein [Victivallales bacterium]
MEQWLLWRDGTHDPFFNMSMDEILLDEAQNIDKVLIRIYKWDRPALSIGCTQKFPKQEESRYCIVRRPTGGGNVFHDTDLTYTAVIPAGHALAQLNRMESYRVFHAAMLPMLTRFGVSAELNPLETPQVDRSTMKCFASPSRFDIITELGGKYAGAAQRRTRKGILHQGSIQLTAAGGDWNKLALALTDAFAAFFQIEFKNGQIPSLWLDKAETLARDKYEKDLWNHEARCQ